MIFLVLHIIWNILTKFEVNYLTIHSTILNLSYFKTYGGYTNFGLTEEWTNFDSSSEQLCNFPDEDEGEGTRGERI